MTTATTTTNGKPVARDGFPCERCGSLDGRPLVLTADFEDGAGPLSRTYIVCDAHADELGAWVRSLETPNAAPLWGETP